MSTSDNHHKTIIQYFMEQRERAGTVGKRQPPIKKPAPSEQSVHFDFRRADSLVVLDNQDGAVTGSYNLDDISNEFLWNFIIGCARYPATVYERHNGAARIAAAKTAEKPFILVTIWWLVEQPLFRSLLQESIRRKLTYPKDVFEFLKRFVLDRCQSLDGYIPWQDVRDTGQISALEPFLSHPVRPIAGDTGQRSRDIQVD